MGAERDEAAHAHSRAQAASSHFDNCSLAVSSGHFHAALPRADCRGSLSIIWALTAQKQHCLLFFSPPGRAACERVLPLSPPLTPSRRRRNSFYGTPLRLSPTGAWHLFFLCAKVRESIDVATDIDMIFSLSIRRCLLLISTMMISLRFYRRYAAEDFGRFAT